MRYLFGVLLIVAGISLLVLAAPHFLPAAMALVRSPGPATGAASRLFSAGGARFSLGAVAAFGGCIMVLQSR